MKNSFLCVSVCLLLASCGNANKPVPAGLTSVQAVTLSGSQQKVVSTGVREMVAKVTVDGGETAKLSGFKAFSLPPKSGIHVCGNVSYQMEPGKPVLHAPYYLELEEINGTPEAKRGQIGSDKLKKSKVTFMCRHVNED